MLGVTLKRDRETIVAFRCKKKIYSSGLMDKNELNAPRGNPAPGSPSESASGCMLFTLGPVIVAIIIAVLIGMPIVWGIALYRHFFEPPGWNIPTSPYAGNQPQIAHFDFTISKGPIYKLTTSGHILRVNTLGPSDIQLTVSGIKLGSAIKYNKFLDLPDEGNDSCEYDSLIDSSAITGRDTPIDLGDLLYDGRFCARINENGVTTDYTFTVVSDGEIHSKEVNGHLVVGRLQLWGPIKIDVHVCKP